MRRFAGEFIHAALQNEGGIDERVVIHPQRGVDALLRLAQRIFRHRLVAVVRFVKHLKLKRGGIGRFAALALKFTNHAVAVAFEVECKFDAHVGRADAQQAVRRGFVAGRFAGFAPERPRHRVEQRGFAMPVVAR